MHASMRTPSGGGWIRIAWRRLVPVLACSALAAGCGGGGSGAGPEADADAVQADRPTSVPADYVVTPQGYFHPSCVVEIQDRERLRWDGDVEAEDGSSRAVAPCGQASFDRRGLRRSTATPPPTVNGWAASASTTATGATSYLSATWTVPRSPARAANQTIYLFPGLEPAATGDVILQPVLAWNGFGDRRWTIASWSCCKDGNVLHSAPRNVSAGDAVTGSVTGTSCDAQGVCSSWRIQTSVPARGISTTLDTSAYGEALDWAFGGALEVYGVDRCDQYPASGSVQFRNVSVRQASGASAAPPWAAYQLSPSCVTGVSAPVATNVSMTTTVSVTWRTSGQ